MALRSPALMSSGNRSGCDRKRRKRSIQGQTAVQRLEPFWSGAGFILRLLSITRRPTKRRYHDNALPPQDGIRQNQKLKLWTPK
jgi:hypothetical protein